MMKKKIAVAMIMVLSLSLAACGKKKDTEKKTEANTKTNTETVTTGTDAAPTTAESTSSATETPVDNTEAAGTPENNVSNDEVSKLVEDGFVIPEEAEDVKWTVLTEATGESGALVQVEFVYDNKHYVAHEQKVGGEELVDISGMYYEWTGEHDRTVDKWGDGEVDLKERISYNPEGTSVCLSLWFDKTTGNAYSLAMITREDVDGYDMRPLVEKLSGK